VKDEVGFDVGRLEPKKSIHFGLAKGKTYRIEDKRPEEMAMKAGDGDSGAMPKAGTLVRLLHKGGAIDTMFLKELMLLAGPQAVALLPEERKRMLFAAALKEVAARHSGIVQNCICA
jgi:hypothetical protein